MLQARGCIVRSFHCATLNRARKAGGQLSKGSGRESAVRRATTGMVDFDAENTRLYVGMAEKHRHERGPWPLMVGEIKALQLKEGSRVLDLASGHGEPASSMALAMPDVRVTSTDVSPDMAIIAAKQADKIPNLDSVIVDMMDLSMFPDASFDAVTVCYGYMFPSDKEKALKETFRVLKPGGTLVSTHWEQMSMMKVNKELLTRLIGTTPPPPPINPLSLCEDGAFRKLAEGAGLEYIKEQRSTYPFSYGTDRVEQYKMGTLTVRPIIEQHGGMEKTMPLWHQLVDEMGGVRTADGDLEFDGNRFCMVVLRKPKV